MLRCVVTVLMLGSLAPVSRAQPTAALHSPVSGDNFTLTAPRLPMIWVRPGTFYLRSTFGLGDDTEVTFTQGYWLGRTEVTQAQWQAVMAYVPLPSHYQGSERPVEKVTWDTVMIFCARLNTKERAAGRLPADYEYSLPTEAQWEYACRAGTTGIFSGDIDAMAWHEANSGGETHPVAQKQPNAWGFHDMHGNVMEWCAGWYGSYPGGRVNDPIGAATGQFNILRGGSWGHQAGACRSAFRHWAVSHINNSGIGFRLALAPRR